MNVVEFILSVKDGASHPLGNLTKTAIGSKFSIDDLTKANDKLRGMTDKTGNSISGVRDKIKKLQEMKELLPINATKQIREVTAEIAKLEKGLSRIESKPKEGGGGIKGLMDGIMGNIPAIAIGGGIISSLNEGMKNSSKQLDFNILLGDKAGANIYEGLKGMKGMLGDGVFDLGKTLADGMNVDQIIPTLSRLGDVAGGDQGKLSNLTAAFAQMSKEGKLTEATLAAMEQGGFKPLVAISETTGQSLSKVRQRFLEGKVSAKEIEKALKGSTDEGGRYFGVMERIANSPQGQWNELINKVSELAGWFGEKLLPPAMKVVSFLISGFEMIKEPLNTIIDGLASLYKWVKSNSEVIAPIATVLGAFAGGIWLVTAAQSAWIAITTALTTSVTAMSASIMAIPVIGWILAAIAAIIAAIVYLRKNFEGFAEFFSTLWEGVKMNFDLFVEGIKYGFGTILYWIETGWLKIKGFGEYIAGMFSNIGKALSLAMDFKFSEAKAVLTAKITTEADNELKSLDKNHKKEQDQFLNKVATKQLWDTQHPLAGLIHRKKEDLDTASEKAVGEGKPKENGTATPKTDLAHNGVKDNINAISGGGVKNITVTVGKMFERIDFNIQNGTKQVAYELERIAEEAVTRAIASASAK